MKLGSLLFLVGLFVNSISFGMVPEEPLKLQFVAIGQEVPFEKKINKEVEALLSQYAQNFGEIKNKKSGPFENFIDVTSFTELADMLEAMEEQGFDYWNKIVERLQKEDFSSVENDIKNTDFYKQIKSYKGVDRLNLEAAARYFGVNLIQDYIKHSNIMQSIKFSIPTDEQEKYNIFSLFDKSEQLQTFIKHYANKNYEDLQPGDQIEIADAKKLIGVVLKGYSSDKLIFLRNLRSLQLADLVDFISLADFFNVEEFVELGLSALSSSKEFVDTVIDDFSFFKRIVTQIFPQKLAQKLQDILVEQVQNASIKEYKTLPLPNVNSVFAVALSNDGELLAVPFGGNDLRIYNMKDDTVMSVDVGGEAYHLAFGYPEMTEKQFLIGTAQRDNFKTLRIFSTDLKAGKSTSEGQTQVTKKLSVAPGNWTMTLDVAIQDNSGNVSFASGENEKAMLRWRSSDSHLSSVYSPIQAMDLSFKGLALLRLKNNKQQIDFMNTGEKSGLSETILLNDRLEKIDDMLFSQNTKNDRKLLMRSVNSLYVLTFPEELFMLPKATFPPIKMPRVAPADKRNLPKVPFILDKSQKKIVNMCLSRNGEQAISVFDGGYINVYSLKTGDTLNRLPIAQTWGSCAINDDGNVFAIGSPRSQNNAAFVNWFKRHTIQEIKTLNEDQLVAAYVLQKARLIQVNSETKKSLNKLADRLITESPNQTFGQIKTIFGQP